MPDTIPTNFEPEILPGWAQKWPQIVWLAEQDLSFRSEVLRADAPVHPNTEERDPYARQRVIKEALRRYDLAHNY